jgi:orotate phosphoribosyltransferase
LPDLLSLVASKEGHFQLESGYHSDRWLELDQLFRRPLALRPFVAELAGRIAAHRLDVIAGPLTGGAFLAELMADALGVEFAFSERIVSDRTGLFPIDYRISPAFRTAMRRRRVAIVDDAISAGSAVKGTYADVEACGATPVVVGVLLAMGSAGPEFATAKGIPLERLADLPLNTWLPQACPLCAAGIALATP